MSQEEVHMYFKELPNVSVMTAQVPPSIMNKLNAAVSNIIETNFQTASPYNSNLLGHMRHEYRLDECIPDLEPYVLHLAQMYDEKYQWFRNVDENYNNSDPRQLRLIDLWVNIQQKHEFNPPHEHTGIMSFAIWMKIPYELADEEKVFPQTSGPNRTSKFTFHYANILGQPCHYAVDVDKNHEGTMVMFPSKLNHSVNPFYTSDDYRISIAGNLRLV